MGVIKTKELRLPNKGKYVVNMETYTCAQDVVRDAEVREITDDDFDDKKKERLDEDWSGVKSYREALDLLANGYQPTVEKFKEDLKTNISSEQKRIKFENAVCGFAPVVPLALKCVPNCMTNMTMKPIKCKVVDVYYDMTVCSSTSPEEIMENGRDILSAIMELEGQGYRFNLYAIQTYSGYNDADMLCVKVKSSDRMLDLKRISFPLTHTAFFRVIGFDWYSRFPKGTYRSGYGQAIGYRLGKDDLKAFAEQMFGSNSVYMNAAMLSGHGDRKEYFKEVCTNVRK